MFYEILKRAQADILFFILILIWNLFCYSLVAHIIFGVSEDFLATFEESLLTVTLLMVGQVTTFSGGELIFNILFAINNLILLNMMIAVVTAHYIEYYLDNSGETLGIIKVRTSNFICSK